MFGFINKLHSLPECPNSRHYFLGKIFLFISDKRFNLRSVDVIFEMSALAIANCVLSESDEKDFD